MEIRSFSSIAACVAALALSFANPAKADTIIAVTGVTFTLSESPVTNGTETFSLQIHLTPPPNGALGGGVFGTIVLDAGNGQQFNIQVPTTTGSPSFSQQVTYSANGTYSPSYTFNGQSLEVANSGYVVPQDESISVSGNFASVTINSVPVPGPVAGAQGCRV
jgi:hypothetical protein